MRAESLKRKGISYRGLLLFICFIWGGAMVWFSLYNILCRALIEIDGTVIETKKEPYPFTNDPKWEYLINTRYACIYTIAPRSGGDNIQYIAHQNDVALAQDLQVGSRIEKNKWEITYKVNGEVIDDFNLRIPIIIGCIGALLMITGLVYSGHYFYTKGLFKR